jgi:hypothetical protein
MGEARDCVNCAPITVLAEPGGCSLQFDPIGKRRFVKSCDMGKTALAKAGVPYAMEESATVGVAVVRIGRRGDGATDVSSFEGGQLSSERFRRKNEAFVLSMNRALIAARYPAKADPGVSTIPCSCLCL